MKLAVKLRALVVQVHAGPVNALIHAVIPASETATANALVTVLAFAGVVGVNVCLPAWVVPEVVQILVAAIVRVFVRVFVKVPV